MSHAATHAYLNTRVSMMSTRLFTSALIKRLTQMALVELAEHFGMSALLDEHPSTVARGRAIEQNMLQLLLAELQVLARPMTAAERSLLLAWGRKYALFNLKTLLRGKLYDLDQQEIRNHLFDLPASIGLPYQELVRAENVLELLRQLETSAYHQIARQAREIYEKHREPLASSRGAFSAARRRSNPPWLDRHAQLRWTARARQTGPRPSSPGCCRRWIAAQP